MHFKSIDYEHEQEHDLTADFRIKSPVRGEIYTDCQTIAHTISNTELSYRTSVRPLGIFMQFGIIELIVG